ncbi:unnamed protein product [Oncorhynchus mykiss]|uniref:Cadherin C-terminal catenin-binding domain-containing protein n=1 Tax=Oncorhynchus mykiss TaxID=8022 RepID=A0A060XAE6_ONCMY|nr:unnamed protein product [Oncorhynchus mykiss]
MEPLDKNSDVRIPSGRHCYGAYPLKLSCLTQEGGGLRDCGREAGSGPKVPNSDWRYSASLRAGMQR